MQEIPRHRKLVRKNYKINLTQKKGGSYGLLHFLSLLCHLGLLSCETIPTVCSKASKGVVTTSRKV